MKSFGRASSWRRTIPGRSSRVSGRIVTPSSIGRRKSIIATMAQEIVIFGTGGNCLDILDTIEELNRASGAIAYRCVGFLDDDQANLGRDYHGAKVLGPLSLAAKLEGAVFVNGI